MGISGITRPYVGQNAQNICDVKQVKDKKPGDVTSPATPEVHRAWAFELAADGTTAVPPPPAGRPGRDPLVIELGSIEVGTRIELISLSDNPKADFDEKHKGEIFELPMTGYDVGNRTATIALNEAQMKEKGVVPGERLMLRQVDKDGNASEAVHVHLDPNGWANQQFNEPVQGGGTQRITGRHIDIATGVMGLDGNPNPGKMERVLGKSTKDDMAPKLLEANVTIKETNTISAAEMKLLNGLLPKLQPALRALMGNVNSNFTAATLTAKLDQNPDWAKDTNLKDHVKVLRDLTKDPSLVVKLGTAINHGRPAGYINPQVNYAAHAEKLPTSFRSLSLERALEPGASIHVQNSRTGATYDAALGDDQRNLSVLLSADTKTGDPLIVTYKDAAGNAGKPYAFNFDDRTADGKEKSVNPLDIRLGAFSIKPPAKDT